MRQLIKKSIPAPVLRCVLPFYHFLLAGVGALRYRLPARSIHVVGVTGTKGKSSVVELLSSVCEAHGMKVAVSSTIHFKIGEEDRPNTYKMTMPGRFFLQRFLRAAVNARCDIAIVEMTSEGVLQHRHRFIDLDGLIVTNISKEHIEAHGSFSAYKNAKVAIAKQLERSAKRPRRLVLNNEDANKTLFDAIDVEERCFFSLSDAKPYTTSATGVTLTIGESLLKTKLPGEFSVQNILAVRAYARALDIPDEDIVSGISAVEKIPGRAESISCGQLFPVIVDYAHTPDSLRALYEAYREYKNRICVLGNTGGGRDTWKRPEMGAIADEYCSEVILTNEDPYDEDPREIVTAMAEGMSKKAPTIIMDRREAIREAIQRAHSLIEEGYEAPVVLISGKGTDPYIMGKGGGKTPWSDATVVREILKQFV